MDRTTECISSRSSRKAILPILWLGLVIWFVRRNYSQQNPAVDEVSWNDADKEENSSTIAFGEATRISQPYGTIPNVTYALANVSTSNKAAVIIETRASGNIVPLVLHFSAVLGAEWPVIIYTPAENFGRFSTSAALSRYQRIGRVVVRPLAEGVWFPDWDSVSAFLTTSWLWEELAPAEHILLFQSDSVLCSNAVRSVEDFFEYDFIGAPILPIYGQGFNGGLSLRKRSTIMKVLTDWTYMAGQEPEDQWFFNRSVFRATLNQVGELTHLRMNDLKDNQMNEGLTDHLVNLPSMEIARTFAVETIDYPNPLGLQPTDEIHRC